MKPEDQCFCECYIVFVSCTYCLPTNMWPQTLFLSSKYVCLFFLIANFQNSVTKSGNDLKGFQKQVSVFANDGEVREKELKTLNVSTAKIAYHPSTTLTDDLMKKVSTLMGMKVTAGDWTSENDMIGNVSEAETMYYGGNVGQLLIVCCNVQFWMHCPLFC